MVVNGFEDFTQMHLSFLQEIGNMGAGNAATAVSEMIAAPTNISVPLVRVLTDKEATTIVDMLSSRTAAYLITLLGDLKGSLLFLIPFDFVERLARSYFPDVSVKSRDQMDEMSASVVQEMVNIVAATYANNFALISGLTVDISTPASVLRPSGQILAVNKPGTMKVCFINTAIEISDSKKSFNVLFFPEADTMKNFMRKVGIDC